MQWLPWHTDAFARARAEDKPVLLSIAASWSESCYEMDSTTYADAAIVARVHERFVPVRVDVDRRPDISERYGLGGWPTTAFLTADGDVIGGGTYVPIERMPSVLDRVTEAFKSGRVERAAEHASSRPPPAATTGSSAPVAGVVSGSEAEALAQQVFVGFDPDHGGFGDDAKFPLTAPLDLALSVYRATNDPGMAQMIETTLDAMGWGGLYDDADGGFFRYAGARDWGQPHREKLLEVNATLLSTYLDAWHTLNVPRYRDRAVDVLRYVQTWLADPVDAGWAGSQAASGARDEHTRANRPYALRRRQRVDGFIGAARVRAAGRDRARRVRAAVARARVARVLQAGPGRRALRRRSRLGARVARRSGLRWPPRISTRTRQPATSSTR